MAEALCAVSRQSVEENMGKILIHDADVLTLNEDGDVLRRTSLAIADGRILRVGESPPDFQADEVIEATDHLAMPGFFNAHTHAAMTLERGWADDLSFDRWLNEKIWVAESALRREDVRWGAYLAAAEMIRSGTVGFADHYFFMDEVARVVEEAGLRATLAWCVFGMGAETEIGAGLEETVDFVQQWQGAADGRIQTVLGPHSPYACPPDFLEIMAQRAADLDVGLHIHLSEFPDQVESSLAQYGVTPVKFLEQRGILDRPTIAAHCIHITPDDMDILQARRVNVVQCPNCHMKLGMGVTPVPELLARGVNVALGTDGPASNNDLDMLEEARLATLLQKSYHMDPVILPAEVTLRLATQNGAKALGFSQSGVIAEGHPADLILLDFRKPHLRPRHNLLSNVVYSAKSPDVRHVIVDGRVLMKDGQLTTLDEERILFEAEKRAFRMVNQDMHIVRAYDLEPKD
jgi:5-methylthioadenosine/S-adenosylhomocysteine deaminase